jgi:hypothetical protein
VVFRQQAVDADAAAADRELCAAERELEPSGVVTGTTAAPPRCRLVAWARRLICATRSFQSASSSG